MDGAKKRVNRSSNFFMMKRLSQKIHTDFDGRMALSFFGITEASGIMHLTIIKEIEDFCIVSLSREASPNIECGQGGFVKL